jgi:ketosteroid isomerase-like protein
MRNLLLFAAAAALLPACQKTEQANAPTAAQTNTAADEKAIRGSIGRWLDLIKAKDAAGIAQFYAEEGAVLPPNQPLVTGRDAIRQFWQSTVDIPEMTLTFGTEGIDFSQSGELAIDRGTYRFTGKPQGRAIDEKGKYVVVWKKIGNDWKVLDDIFNSDAPPAGG